MRTVGLEKPSRLTIMLCLRPNALRVLAAAIFFLADSLPLAEARQQQTGALALYNQALRLRSRNPAGSIETLKQVLLADPSFYRAYDRLLDITAEIEQAGAALTFLEELAGGRDQHALYGLAAYHRRQKDLEKASGYATRCISVLPDFAPAYREMVDISLQQGRLSDTIKRLAEAVAKDPAHVASRFGLGYAYFLNRDYSAALEQLNKAIELSPAFSPTFSLKVQALYYSDRFEEALGVLRMMLARAEQESDIEAEERVNGFIGSILIEQGELLTGVEHLNKALRLARDLGHRGDQQSYLANLGLAYMKLGRNNLALDFSKEALTLTRGLRQTANEARVMSLIGDIHAALANYSNAIDSYDYAIEIAKKMGDRPNEANLIASIASVYSDLGDHSKALDRLKIAVVMARELKNKGLEAGFLQSQGTALAKSGKLREAIATYEESLTICETIGNKADAAALHSLLGNVRTAMGDYAGAIRNYQRSLEIGRDTGSPILESRALNGLGNLYAQVNEHEKAESEYRRALAIARGTLDAETEWQAEAGIGAALRRQERLKEALDHYRRAVELVENIRARLETADEKAGFIQDRIKVYKGIVALLVSLHESEPAGNYGALAFHYTERGRARAFLDLLAESKMNVEEGISPELRRREEEIQSRISLTQSQLIKEHSHIPADSERVKVLEAGLKQADEEHQQLRREIRRLHARYAAVRYPEAIGLEQTQKMLDGDALMLEYSIGETESFVFAVGKTEFSIARIPPRELLTSRIMRLRQALSTPARASMSGFIVDSRRLYQDMIEPVARLFNGKKELIVVADGVAHYLPFEVLLQPGERSRGAQNWTVLPYLVRDYAISYAHSAGVLAGLVDHRVDRAAPGKTFLGIGDAIYGEEEPDATTSVGLAVRTGLGGGKQWKLARLSRSGEEVKRIAQLHSLSEADLFLRDAANEENVKADGRMARYRTIHFAVHGLLNETNPRLSGLVLTLPADKSTGQAEDGLLQTYEIFNLKLNADMVVLSACETALGKQVTGEGLLGLTRAFMYAGTSSVVSSLWKSADVSSEELMVRFYRQLKSGVNRAEALRRARIELVGGGRFAHPYFWAPFVLIGSSR